MYQYINTTPAGRRRASRGEDLARERRRAWPRRARGRRRAPASGWSRWTGSGGRRPRWAWPRGAGSGGGVGRGRDLEGREDGSWDEPPPARRCGGRARRHGGRRGKRDGSGLSGGGRERETRRGEERDHPKPQSPQPPPTPEPREATATSATCRRCTLQRPDSPLLQVSAVCLPRGMKSRMLCRNALRFS